MSATATPAQLQGHRAQLAKWCALHKITPPSGPVVDAFVAEMGTKHYGVEETWDAFAWFRHGWEAVTLVPAGWRYRYGASAWKYVPKESDCNPAAGYERQPVFVLHSPT